MWMLSEWNITDLKKLGLAGFRLFSSNLRKGCLPTL
jgi:hypothetical protein